MDTTISLNKTSSLKKIPFLIGVVLSFLLPIFIIPANTYSFVLGKNVILFSSVALLFLLWVIERIKSKDFFLSKNLLVISAYLVPISYLLSALFSGSIMAGLIGYGFETSTFVFIGSLFVLMFLTARAFNNKQKVLYLYTGLILSSVIMAIVHILRLFFGADFLSLGLFNTTTSNLIGSWNEFSLFFGLIALISLIANEYLGRDKMTKILSSILLVISLLFVWLVNFNLVWMFLMLASLFLVIYSLFLNKRQEDSVDYSKLYKTPAPYVFVITLLFVFLQGTIGGILPSMFGISNYEVRPTISSTFSIAISSLKTDPLLGVGPTKFINQWVAYKPQGVNNTEFWNTDFNTGAGFILTSLTTVGLLGFISWMLFIISFIYLGFRLLKKSRNNQLDHFVALSLFLSAVYLIMFLVFYIPGIVILGLTFLILGVLLSFLKQDNLVKVNKISLLHSKSKSIGLVTTMIIFIGVNGFGGYLFTQKVLASVQFNEGVLAINVDNDFNKGYEKIVGAVNKYPTDFYYRNLTDLNLMQLQNVFNQKDVSEEDLQKQFQDVFSATVGSAQRALQLDMNNYQNWVNIAKVYGAVVPLKLENSYESALQAYSEAIRLNPSNPLLVLNLANLEIANEDLEKAREYIGISIQMKNNYSDAYYLLSQIELNAGDKEKAIQVIEALANVSPNDPQVFLQLGAFNYEEKDYERAQAFLERAVILNPYYSDAKYLLALTYDVMGEKEKALGQFSDLKILNPNDENIDAILKNVEEGRDPFYGFEQQASAPAPAPAEDVTTEEDNTEVPEEVVEE
ncbi:tetratricopeptide repeat protein [Patescibacteria group bacterium]|nr:tetratricopeptide repeat protein [Patescibacteria group bacterium]